jgi:hypothetical protein
MSGFGAWEEAGLPQRWWIATIPNEIHARRVDIDPAEVMGDGVGRPKASDGPTRSEKGLAW